MIDDQTVAGICHTFTPCHLRSREQQMAQQRFIPYLCLPDAWYRLTRNYQNVKRCLRCKVSECDTVLVFENESRGNFLITNFFKNRLVGHDPLKCRGEGR